MAERTIFDESEATAEEIECDFENDDYSYLISDGGMLLEMDKQTGRKFLLVPIETLSKLWHIPVEIILSRDDFLDAFSIIREGLGQFPLKRITVPEEYRNKHIS